jgi:hypothetical protein
VTEGGAREYEAALLNLGTIIGYRRWAELNKFMCGIDGRVMQEVPKREGRDTDGLRGGCSGVDSPAVKEFAATAAASAVAVTSAMSKVYWGSLSMSQTGEEWGGVDAVLAFLLVLSSPVGCASWYSFTNCGA